MYLFIFEDGSVSSAEDMTEEDFVSADEGLLDIIDVSDPSNLKQYLNGQWDPVDKLYD